MGRCHASNDPGSFYLYVPSWIKKLNVKTCASWRYLRETTICRGKCQISEPPSVYHDQPRDPDLTCTACARPADGDDLLSCHLTNVQAPHLCFSAEHFYQDLCKYSPTFWDVYILTARSQVLETGGGWQGPKNYFNLISAQKCPSILYNIRETAPRARRGPWRP